MYAAVGVQTNKIYAEANLKSEVMNVVHQKYASYQKCMNGSERESERLNYPVLPEPISIKRL